MSSYVLETVNNMDHSVLSVTCNVTATANMQMQPWNSSGLPNHQDSSVHSYQGDYLQHPSTNLPTDHQDTYVSKHMTCIRDQQPMNWNSAEIQTHLDLDTYNPGNFNISMEAEYPDAADLSVPCQWQGDPQVTRTDRSILPPTSYFQDCHESLEYFSSTQQPSVNNSGISELHVQRESEYQDHCVSEEQQCEKWCHGAFPTSQLRNNNRDCRYTWDDHSNDIETSLDSTSSENPSLQGVPENSNSPGDTPAAGHSNNIPLTSSQSLQKITHCSPNCSDDVRKNDDTSVCLSVSSDDTWRSTNDQKSSVGKRKKPAAKPKNENPPFGTDVPLEELSGVGVDHLISCGVMVAGYKPRNIIRKRAKTPVPKAGKDEWYWEKRRKNNESARRSRELKKEKEKDFYRRALELEYENVFLRERIGLLEAKLSCVGSAP